MSKSSNVVVITVSSEQFNQALAGIATNGASIVEQMIIACKFIAQATNKKEQDSSKKALTQAYQTLQTKLTGKPFLIKSAQTWVQRNVKRLSGNDKFKWLESKTANAKRMRAVRAGAKKETAPAKAPAKKETTPSIVQYRDAIIAQENKIRDEYRNLIPAGKLEVFDKTFATFIQTLNEILK